MTLYRILEAQEGELFFDTLQEAKHAYVQEIIATHRECLQYLDVDNKELRMYLQNYRRTGVGIGPSPLAHGQSCLCSLSRYTQVCANHAELYTLEPHAWGDCPRIGELCVQELCGSAGAETVVERLEDGVFYGLERKEMDQLQKTFIHA